MLLKTWSGKISINGAEVDVNVVLTSEHSGLKEWHGSGIFSSFGDYKKLSDSMRGSAECQTSIGNLFLTNLNSNGTFTFQGTGPYLY